MYRFLLFLLLCTSVGLTRPAAAFADELPPRPSPFRFVNDQAQLMSPADVRTLESGLRRYADKTGTQLVVVTVPTLGGQDVADYGRALGQAWGIGQRDKNNGIVVLLGAQEHKVTIQAGEGLRSQITPELTNRVINQQMTPSFKEGRYFAGLRSGLNALMVAADPSSAPQGSSQNQSAAAAAAAGTTPNAGTNATGSGLTDELPPRATTPDPAAAPIPAYEPSSFGIGSLLMGAALIGGVLWLISRFFKRKQGPANAPMAQSYPGNSPTPDFLPNRSNTPNQPNPMPTSGRGPNSPQGQGSGPDFFPNRSNSGGGMGSGMGGVLMTGAAAAAGAYLGNRMASGHDTNTPAHLNNDPTPSSAAPDAAAGAGAYTAGGGFPALGGTNEDNGGNQESAPDYFSEDNTAAEPDYFSEDESSSYDDTSSDDTGGGGFDDDNSNSGEW